MYIIIYFLVQEFVTLLFKRMYMEDWSHGDAKTLGRAKNIFVKNISKKYTFYFSKKSFIKNIFKKCSMKIIPEKIFQKKILLTTIFLEKGGGAAPFCSQGLD